MKVVKRVFAVILGIPVFIVVLFIAYEIFGIIVNYAATDIQTRKLTNTVKEIEDLEVIDIYNCVNSAPFADNIQGH